MGITSIRPAADACGAHHSRRVEEPRVVAQIPKVGIQYSLCFYKGHLGNVVIEPPGHALSVVEAIITEYDTDSLGPKLDEARETALGALIVMLDKISLREIYPGLDCLIYRSSTPPTLLQPIVLPGITARRPPSWRTRLSFEDLAQLGCTRGPFQRPQVLEQQCMCLLLEHQEGNPHKWPRRLHCQ